jgi:hypothetical protein
MDPPEFTSKALTTMAAAALLAMVCVLWMTTMPPLDVTEISKMPAASPDVPVFQLLR